MFSYSGLSFNAAASRELGLMPSYTKTQEDSDCEDIWHSLSSSMMWMTIDMDESESSSKEGSEEVLSLLIPRMSCIRCVLVKFRKFVMNDLVKLPNVGLFLFSFQVRTVFVSGLPMDVRPREIYLLFRPYSVSWTEYQTVGQKVIHASSCYVQFVQ